MRLNKQHLYINVINILSLKIIYEHSRHLSRHAKKTVVLLYTFTMFLALGNFHLNVIQYVAHITHTKFIFQILF